MEIQIRADSRNQAGSKHKPGNKNESCNTDKFDTIYFGGGTPSLLVPDDIEKILTFVHKFFTIAPDPEITIEINPGTVDQNYFFDIKSLGINRINLGVQSFQEKKLQFLNRIHSADQAKKTIEWALKADFQKIGLDLIYGLPKENKKSWIADMNAALNFAPCHLSCYMLTYETGTKMYNDLKKGLITPLKDDMAADLFTTTSLFLEKSKYIHYEISNFASNETSRSIHNQKYWSGIPYLGLGPSAHSFDTEIRFWNCRDVQKYIELLKTGKLPVLEQEILTVEQKTIEMIMLGLRTNEGINLIKFQNLTGKKFISCFESITKDLELKSMGVINKENFYLTLKGMLFLDSITALFTRQILDNSHETDISMGRH